MLLTTIFLSKIKDFTIPKVDMISPSSTRTSAAPDLNIVFGLSGNHSGFLAEFKVALKSVLMNAPIDHGLNIHVIGDEEAYNSLAQIFNETQILTWKTRQQINVHTYDITNLIPTIRKWQASISKKHNKIGDGERLHTIGTFFRWFAADVIDVNELQSKYVLYMDTDVVILVNLAELIPRTNNQDVSFQWSKGMNAGFMLINLEKQVQDRELLRNMTDYHILMANQLS